MSKKITQNEIIAKNLARSCNDIIDFLIELNKTNVAETDVQQITKFLPNYLNYPGVLSSFFVEFIVETSRYIFQNQNLIQALKEVVFLQENNKEFPRI